MNNSQQFTYSIFLLHCKHFIFYLDITLIHRSVLQNIFCMKTFYYFINFKFTFKLVTVTRDLG